MGVKGVGAIFRAHHVIPWELRDHPVIQRMARLGWDINGKQNGLLLPYSTVGDAASLAQHFKLHRNPNSVFEFHSGYNREVRELLDNFGQRAVRMSDDELIRQFESIMRKARNCTRLNGLPIGTSLSIVGC